MTTRLSLHSLVCNFYRKKATYGQDSFHVALTRRVHREAHSRNFGKKENISSSTNDATINIPNRVQRSPTSILEALASTVNYNPTGFHYKVIDDPALYPQFTNEFRSMLLSEQSGRLVAESTADESSWMFQPDASAPKVESFTPKIFIHNDDSVEALQERITSNKVNDAITIYEKLTTNGTEIAAETKIALLDLLCRFNSCDPPPINEAQEFLLPENTSDKSWRPSPIVMQLFKELKPTYPQAFISIIMGRTKFRDYTGAWQCYVDAKKINILLPTEVHNAILSDVLTRFNNIQQFWDGVREILIYMEEHGIRPDLDTFNTILLQLSKLPRFTYRYQLALQTLKEMKNCGIEPSLGSYTQILKMVYRAKKPRHSDVLQAILSSVTEKTDQFELRHPVDVDFFKVAMEASAKCNDVETAHMVYKLAFKGNNKRLLGDMYNQTNMCGYYFDTVLRSEPMEEIMVIFRDLIPRVFYPRDDQLKGILDAVELYEGFEHLPEIFDAIKTSMRMNASVLSRLTSLIASKHVREEVRGAMLDLADEIKRSVESRGYGTMLPLMYADFIELSLNCNKLDRAFNCFIEYKKLSDATQSGMEKTGPFVRLCESLLSAEDTEKTLEVFHALQRHGCTEEIKQVMDNYIKSKRFEELPDDFREQVCLMIGKPKKKRKKNSLN